MNLPITPVFSNFSPTRIHQEATLLAKQSPQATDKNSLPPSGVTHDNTHRICRSAQMGVPKELQRRAIAEPQTIYEPPSLAPSQKKAHRSHVKSTLQSTTKKRKRDNSGLVKSSNKKNGKKKPVSHQHNTLTNYFPSTRINPTVVQKTNGEIDKKVAEIHVNEFGLYQAKSDSRNEDAYCISPVGGISSTANFSAGTQSGTNIANGVVNNTDKALLGKTESGIAEGQPTNDATATYPQHTAVLPSLMPSHVANTDKKVDNSTDGMGNETPIQALSSDFATTLDLYADVHLTSEHPRAELQGEFSQAQLPQTDAQFFSSSFKMLPPLNLAQFTQPNTVDQPNEQVSLDPPYKRQIKPCDYPIKLVMAYSEGNLRRRKVLQRKYWQPERDNQDLTKIVNKHHHKKALVKKVDSLRETFLAHYANRPYDERKAGVETQVKQHINIALMCDNDACEVCLDLIYDANQTAKEMRAAMHYSPNIQDNQAVSGVSLDERGLYRIKDANPKVIMQVEE